MAALQLVLEYNVKGTPAKTCPTLHIHRLALRTAIRELNRTTKPKQSSPQTVTFHSENTSSGAIRSSVTKSRTMDSKPATNNAKNVVHKGVYSPPLPPSTIKLTPRSLSSDLQIDMSESLGFDDNTAVLMLGVSPRTFLRNPTVRNDDLTATDRDTQKEGDSNERDTEAVSKLSLTHERDGYADKITAGSCKCCGIPQVLR